MKRFHVEKGERLLQIYRGCLSRKLSSNAAPDNVEKVKPFSEMPGASAIPTVLALRKVFLQGPNYEANNIFHSFHQKHGKIIRARLPGRGWWVSTRSIEDAELMFRLEGDYPSRGTHEDNLMWIYKKIDLPPPMFFSNGDVWKRIRSNAAKQIVPRKVSNFVLPLCKTAEDFIEHLESLMDDSGNVANIAPEINKWAFQGVSYFVYGEKINTYTTTDPLQQEFIEAGLDYIRGLGDITHAIPIYKIFPTKAYKNYVKIVRRTHAAGQTILQDHFERLKEKLLSGGDDDKAVGLIDQWLKEGKFTEREALTLSYDMMSAGIDTTANSSTFLLFELAKNPEIQQQVIEEISSVLGDKENPSWEDLQKMNLIRSCIKETMRIYMPIEGIPRQLPVDAVFSGYLIPAWTSVSVDYAYIARSEEFITKPYNFIPQRWNKNAEEKLPPFLSLPFGFGPRSCYGRRLAELGMFILLTKMLSKYTFTTNVEKLKMTRAQVVLRPTDPLQIKFTKRA